MKESHRAAQVLELAAHNYEFDLKTGGDQTGAGITKALYDIALENYEKVKQTREDARVWFERQTDNQQSFAKLTSDVMTMDQMEEAIKGLGLR